MAGIRMLAASALLASTMLQSTGSAQTADGAIREVTLSSGGLAEVIRSAPVGGGAVEIRVPLEQVNDVLKSLVVIGGTGRVKAISLGGLSPVEETMRTMPFAATDMAGLPSLLGRLQGVTVEVEGAGRKLQGTVLGVGFLRGENGAETPMLSLVAAGGSAVSVALTADVSVKILDAAVLAKIEQAAAVIGRASADGERTVRVVLDGPGTGTAEIAYVVAAPIWKTAYRVVTDAAAGTARLQAWAVLENATGENWTGVKLTLSSGSPVTLSQRLHERYWRQRPEVPVDVDGAPLPRPDEGGMEQDAMASYEQAMPAAPAMAMAEAVVGGAPAPQRQMRMRAMYDNAAATSAASASDSDVTASFAVETPVDVLAGDTLSVPIVDSEVKAERISLYQPGVAGVHPVAALMLKNDTPTSLPPGILTVYDGQVGYVGDAQLLGMPSGEERMVSFAVDRKVRIDAEEFPERSILSIKALDGILTASVRTRARTVYTIVGADDGAREIVVEHPRRAGWEFSGSASMTLTETARRLRTSVAAGGAGRIEAIDEIVENDTIALFDADPQFLLSWASQTEDPAVGASLQRLSDARAAMVAVERQIEELETRREDIRQEQERIRQNLGAVPAESALAAEYLASMKSQEDELGGIARQRDELRRDLEARRKALEEVIGGI